MSLKKSQIEAFLTTHNVTFEPLSPKQDQHIKKQWLLAYAAKVKKDTGVWIHNRFRWHGFSYGLQTAVSGSQALASYKTQWPASYVVFDEEDTWAYACTSPNYPDFTVLRADIYVAHHNMKWTMIFTHEHPDIGPYLALKSENTN